MRRTLVWFSLLIAVSAVAKEAYHYPKASDDADTLIELRSNEQRTTFWVDGVKMPRGRRVKVLVSDRPHTIVAQPEGFISKEEYIQPPYYQPYILSFTYMIGERDHSTDQPRRETAQYDNRNNDQSSARYDEPSVATRQGRVETAAPAPQLPPGLKLDPSATGKYFALIIGNDDYKYLPGLATARGDAKAVAAVLQSQYGFTTRVLLDATRADILDALYNYRSRLTKDDNLLIYYAGHGWLDKAADEGYWLPVDAKKGSDADWLSNASLTASLRAIPAYHILVIADSCYSGKLTRGINMETTAGSGGYLAKVYKKKSRTVLASGGLEPVADSGGKGGHSVFASALIDALKGESGEFTGMDLFLKVRRPVLVNADQSPEYADIRKAGHDGGEFVFIPKPTH